MDTLATWDDGWEVVGDARNKTYLAVALTDEDEIADNMFWDFEPIEDDAERATEFAALLDILINAEVVDTEHLTGLAFDATHEFNWDDQGRARAIYTLKSENSETSYVANHDDLGTLLELMRDFAPSEDTEEPAEDTE